MLRLFSRIRQSLTGPTGTKSSSPGRNYFFYAIGEITLVVIGILIALQVNNWNEYRKMKALEIKTLLEISSDIEATLQDIRLDTRLHEISRDASKSLLDFVSSEQVWNDSLAMLFELAYYEFRISSIETTYRSLETRGVDLISDPELRKLISLFYDYAIPWLRRVEVGGGKFHDLLLPYYQNNFTINLDTSIVSKMDIDASKKLRNAMPRGFIPVNKDALKRDSNFKVLLRETIYERIEIIQAHVNADTQAVEILELIQKKVQDAQ